jgi:hypothetical protein
MASCARMMTTFAEFVLGPLGVTPRTVTFFPIFSGPYFEGHFQKHTECQFQSPNVTMSEFLRAISRFCPVCEDDIRTMRHAEAASGNRLWGKCIAPCELYAPGPLPASSQLGANQGLTTGITRKRKLQKRPQRVPIPSAVS